MTAELTAIAFILAGTVILATATVAIFREQTRAAAESAEREEETLP